MPDTPLHNVLKMIERSQSKILTLQQLSETAYLSESHLQLLFKKLTGQPVMSYARGRKLAYCLNDLFKSDMRVIDIAYKYGFAHEQSFERAFKSEFGCTPGIARKEKRILKIREYIVPEYLSHAGGGYLYGPEHVVVPAFLVAGIPTLFEKYDRFQGEELLGPNKAGNDAFYPILCDIPHADHNVYYGICNYINETDVVYMPSVKMNKEIRLPEGMEYFSFPVHNCVRFRYVGEHPPEAISIEAASDTYDVIDRFFREQVRYVRNTAYHCEKIDTRWYDGIYSQMELYYPVKDNFENPG